MIAMSDDIFYLHANIKIATELCYKGKRSNITPFSEVGGTKVLKEASMNHLSSTSWAAASTDDIIKDVRQCLFRLFIAYEWERERNYT